MVFIIPTPFILTASEITSVSSYGDQGLQLFRCDNKPSERYTHVSIVVADYGVLDHLGAELLIDDVVLKRWLDCAWNKKVNSFKRNHLQF